MAQAFDVVVIGAGPGGYIAAVRAAQLGFKTACIEGWKNAKGELALGGTCLNVGCIPSKALLATSEEFEKVGKHLERPRHQRDGREDRHREDAGAQGRHRHQDDQGRRVPLQEEQDHVAAGLRQVRERRRDLHDRGGQRAGHEAKYVIVATGSKARHLPDVPVDNEIVCDNEGALAFGAVPKRLGVIGAGVIGLELGSVWRRLGSEVTILEALPNFLGAVRRRDRQGGVEAIHQDAGPRHLLGVKIEQGHGEEGRRRSSTRTARAPRRSSSATSSSSPSAACRTPTAWAPRPWASRSTRAASSRWTTIAAPTCRTSMRSATWCAGRCSRTRPRTRA